MFDSQGRLSGNEVEYAMPSIGAARRRGWRLMDVIRIEMFALAWCKVGHIQLLELAGTAWTCHKTRCQQTDWSKSDDTPAGRPNR